MLPIDITAAGQRIRELRMTARKSQFWVERQTGIDRSRISLAECGHSALSDDDYSRIEKVLSRAIDRKVSAMSQAQRLQDALCKLNVTTEELASSLPDLPSSIVSDVIANRRTIQPQDLAKIIACIVYTAEVKRGGRKLALREAVAV